MATKAKTTKKTPILVASTAIMVFLATFAAYGAFDPSKQTFVCSETKYKSNCLGGFSTDGTKCYLDSTHYKTCKSVWTPITVTEADKDNCAIGYAEVCGVEGCFCCSEPINKQVRSSCANTLNSPLEIMRP